MSIERIDTPRAIAAETTRVDAKNFRSETLRIVAGYGNPKCVLIS